MRGVTFSITLPKQMEARYSEEAKQRGISRSKHIHNCLLQLEALTAKKKTEKQPINDCANRGEGNYCCNFPIECRANQENAESCEGYRKL